jgi:adenylate cyclase
LRNTNSTDLLYDTISHPNTIFAYNSRFDAVLNQDIRSLSKTGTTEFPVSSNGKVYEVPINEQSLLMGARMVEPLIQRYEPFMLNPNTSLPVTYSAIDVINNSIPPSSLTDKYVFVGSTSTLLNDFVEIPKLNVIPGITLHAMVANQILQNKDHIDNKVTRNTEFMVSMALLLLLNIDYGKFQNYYKIPLLLAIYIGIFTPFIYIFTLNALIAMMISLTAGFLVIKLGTLTYEKYHLHNVLQGHFSPPVMKKLLNTPDSLNATGKGEKTEVSIMFTDLRNFTKYSEQVEAETVANDLNEVLGLQADLIIQRSGVVDKFIGDSVMAFWGAPFPDPHHSFHCLHTGCCIVKTFDTLRKEKGYSFDIGIGMNMGSVVVGNFGSKKRFNYTVIGDPVNSASRIESLTKQYKSKILISGQLLHNLTDQQQSGFKFEHQDTVQLRGKRKKTDIYSVTAFRQKDGSWYHFDTY